MKVCYLDEESFQGHEELIFAINFVLQLIRKVNYANLGLTSKALSTITKVSILVGSDYYRDLLKTLPNVRWLNDCNFVIKRVTFSLESIASYRPLYPIGNEREILLSIGVSSNSLVGYDSDGILVHVVVPERVSGILNYLTERNAVPIQIPND